jgi:mono/diheme cytochrome c family protein
MGRASAGVVVGFLLGAWTGAAMAAEPVLTTQTAAERGLRFIRTEPLVPAHFTQDVFDNVWRVWPEPLRSQAERASSAGRRRMAFSRYGLIEPPDGDGGGPALGYVDGGEGRWVMNCLSCHGGKVAGRVVPGLPNSHFAFQSLIEETRLAKLEMQVPLSDTDLAALTLPLGGSNGTTNAVVFGILLGAMRDEDLNLDRDRPSPPVTHHDMDAPPLWNVRKKSMLYIDGHIEKGHRPLVQFMLTTNNAAAAITGRERKFADVLAWIESLEPPAWPWETDAALAARGEAAFNAHCASCHGTYGERETYPEKTVPIEVVGTDPLRLTALTLPDRRKLKDGWISDYGRERVVVDPEGYVAPPLDGVWASGPYFHNGSVPTLWHVLHPNERPAVWKRTEDGYDRDRVGLEVETFTAIPPQADTPIDRRTYFETALPGKSAAGHDFPDALTDDEKRAVLEYLKTL